MHKSKCPAVEQEHFPFWNLFDLPGPDVKETLQNVFRAVLFYNLLGWECTCQT